MAREKKPYEPDPRTPGLSEIAERTRGHMKAKSRPASEEPTVENARKIDQDRRAYPAR